MATPEVLEWMDTHDYFGYNFTDDDSSNIIAAAERIARSDGSKTGERNKKGFLSFVENNVDKVDDKFGERIRTKLRIIREEIRVETKRKIERAGASQIYKVTIPEGLTPDEQERLQNLLSERKVEMVRRRAFSREFKRAMR